MKKLLYITFLVFLQALVFAGNNDRIKSQTKTVVGRITDANGEAIAGAKVIVSETGETVYADLEGQYKLEIKTDKNYSLSIETIGYQPLILNTQTLGAFSDISLKEL